MIENVLEIDPEYMELARSTRRMSSLLVFPKASLRALPIQKPS